MLELRDQKEQYQCALAQGFALGGRPWEIINCRIIA